MVSNSYISFYSISLKVWHLTIFYGAQYISFRLTLRFLLKLYNFLKTLRRVGVKPKVEVEALEPVRSELYDKLLLQI